MTIPLTPAASTTATFDPALSSQRDHIRLAIGDTDTDAALVADTTIDALLAEYPYTEALALLCDALIAEFGQMPDRYSEQQGIALQWTQRIEAWSRLATLARSGQIKTPGAGTQITRRGVALGMLHTQRYLGRDRRHVADLDIPYRTSRDFRSD